jgi:hypothetical protein
MKPSTHSPGRVLEARSRMAAWMAAIERRSQFTCFRCSSPLDAVCRCASIKPGVTVRPPRSTLAAPDVGIAWISAFEPTARKRPPAMATA